MKCSKQNPRHPALATFCADMYGAEAPVVCTCRSINKINLAQGLQGRLSATVAKSVSHLASRLPTLTLNPLCKSKTDPFTPRVFFA